MRPPEPGLTEETIVARSRDLIPVLRKRAVQAERARELPRASGTSATQAGEAMERIYRDMAMIRTHYIMDHDRKAENWGASAFGLEAYSPN